MIPDPNTIIDPRAMMIEPFHTSIAYTAMSTFTGSDGLTVRTQLSSVKIFQEFQEIDFIFQVTRVTPVTQKDKEQSKQTQNYMRKDQGQLYS